MYEILRVPPGPGHMKKAYDWFIAFAGGSRLTWQEFYNSVKSVYMVTNNTGYHGMGIMRLNTLTDDMKNMIKINPADDTVYEMITISFNEEDRYIKYYELIKTLINDCFDKMIIVQNVPNEYKEIVNALKNNKFKPIKSSNQYTTSFYKIGNLWDAPIERNFKSFNPRDDLHTIDKHTCLCDNYDREKELQDKLIAYKLNENIEALKNQEINCGCIECCCDQNRQTAEEFLGVDICKRDDLICVTLEGGGGGGCLEIRD